MHPRSSVRPRFHGWLAVGLGAVVALGALLSGCSGGGSNIQVCSSNGQGALAVTIVSAGGVSPEVLVTGPGNYQKTLGASTTLANLGAGTYLVETLRVATAPSGGSPVGTAYGATSDPVVSACVKDGQTATVMRTYAQQPGSGRLWSANEVGGAVVAYDAVDLAAGGAHGAAAVIDLTPSTLNTTFGFQLAFGPSGSLWIADPVGGNSGNGQVLLFFQGKLASSGSPPPDLVLEAPGFDRLSQLAFDSDGDLWILNRGADQILEYTAAQVRNLLREAGGATVNTAPANVYAGSGTELQGPRGLAFDTFGSLWVAGEDPDCGCFRLLRYDGPFGSGGTLTAAFGLRTTSSPLMFPTAMAFDASNNLWTVGGGLDRYDASQLVGSGTLSNATPAYSTSAIGGTSQSPGIALDAAGNVWLSGEPSHLDRFLTGTATVQSDWLASSDLEYPMGIALYPSPLSGALPLR